jgi:hypothetical protein
VLPAEAAALTGEAPQSAEPNDEPRGIEPARLVRFLRTSTYTGAAILASGSFLLGLPLHRWPRLALALAYYTAAGLSMLVGAGLSWAALRRTPNPAGDDRP